MDCAWACSICASLPSFRISRSTSCATPSLGRSVDPSGAEATGRRDWELRSKFCTPSEPTDWRWSWSDNGGSRTANIVAASAPFLRKSWILSSFSCLSPASACTNASCLLRSAISSRSLLSAFLVPCVDRYDRRFASARAISARAAVICPSNHSVRKSASARLALRRLSMWTWTILLAMAAALSGTPVRKPDRNHPRAPLLSDTQGLFESANAGVPGPLASNGAVGRQQAALEQSDRLSQSGAKPFDGRRRFAQLVGACTGRLLHAVQNAAQMSVRAQHGDLRIDRGFVGSPLSCSGKTSI